MEVIGDQRRRGSMGGIGGAKVRRCDGDGMGLRALWRCCLGVNRLISFDVVAERLEKLEKYLARTSDGSWA